MNMKDELEKIVQQSSDDLFCGLISIFLEEMRNISKHLLEHLISGAKIRPKILQEY
jgi:hypothetical protein